MALPRRPYLTAEVVSGLREIYTVIKEDPILTGRIPDDKYDDVVVAAKWLKEIDKFMKHKARMAKRAKSKGKDG